MKNLFIFCLSFYCFVNLQAQNAFSNAHDLLAQADDSRYAFTQIRDGAILLDKFVGQRPEFPGGEVGMKKYIQAKVVYPEIARSHGHEGTVVISFIVQADGRVTSPKVVKGIGLGCNEAALKVMEDMPLWQPAFQGGRSVAVKMNTEVKFKLF